MYDCTFHLQKSSFWTCKLATAVSFFFFKRSQVALTFYTPALSSLYSYACNKELQSHRPVQGQQFLTLKHDVDGDL
ncbi:hypothetical protein FKM82_018215 [Ascaphus truei]